MNAATMQDPGTPSAGSPTAPVPRRRAWWPWLLGAALLFVVLAAVAVATLLAVGADLVATIAEAGRDGVHLLIDGESWHLNLADPWQWLLLIGGVMLALVIVAVVVPLAVLAALVSAALGIALAVGAVLLVLALVLSPLWLVVLLLWLVLKS